MQVNRLSQDGRTERKAAPPLAVADYCYGILPWDFVLSSREGSANDSLDAQRRKIAARNKLTPARRQLCLPVHTDVQAATSTAKDSGESSILISDSFV